MSNHIDHIEITNFKSIRHAKIEGCKRINVFIGYPNVGKSNILEALSLFSIPLLPFGESFHLTDLARLQHFSEIFFNKDYRSNLAVNVHYKGTDDRVTELELTGKLETNQRTLKIVFNHFLHEHGVRTNLRSNKSVNGVATISDSNFGISYGFEASEPLPHTVKKYSYVSDVKIRSNDNFSLSIPYGENLIDLLQRNFEFGKELVGIFKEYDLKLFLEADSISLTKELPSGIAVRIPYYQMADTLRRLIFYKAAIMSNEDSVLLFEEPEAHMFPPYVSKFTGDIIHDEKNNQYFISTHSPFVLNDLMEDAKDELSIYAVGLHNGETTIKRITDKEMHEIYQYGIDLFFNLEDYLKDV